MTIKSIFISTVNDLESFSQSAPVLYSNCLVVAIWLMTSSHTLVFHPHCLPLKPDVVAIGSEIRGKRPIRTEVEFNVA